jgi:hypothetical protein
VVSGQPDLARMPPRLREIVTACLAKNPAERPGLTALAAMISRAGPPVAATPTSFWPGPVAVAIRQYQTGSGYDASYAMATNNVTAREPGSREVAYLEAAQAATRAPAAGRPQPAGGPPPQTPAVAWPERSRAPYPPAPGWSAQPAPAPPAIPGPVRTAIRLMYAGAAVSLVNVIVSLAAINLIKTAFEAQHPLAQHSAQVVATLAAAGVIISGLVGIWIWLGLASATRKGRSWPRTAGTILLGLDTIGLLTTLGRANIPTVKVFGVLIWLIGLMAVISLWRRQSSDYFDHSRRR